MIRIATPRLSLAHGLVSSIPSRAFSSTPTMATLAGEIHSPAVASILGKTRISLDVASKIPRTGPKGRLLKGDVLAFLASPSDLSTSPVIDHAPFQSIPVVYHSLRMDIPCLRSINDPTLSDLRDVVASAVATTLVDSPKVNARFNLVDKKASELPAENLLLVRESVTGRSSMLVATGKKLDREFISRKFINDPTSRNSADVFQMWDYIGSGISETPTALLAHTDTAVLMVHLETPSAIEYNGSVSTTDDLFGAMLRTTAQIHTPSSLLAADQVGGSVLEQVEKRSTNAVSYDVFESMLNRLPVSGAIPTQGSLVFELAVDDRAVSRKTATAFLDKLYNQLQNPVV
ncbi:hypothetical protein BASA61_009398 [Batrachochytrium salamandrivorans]|nr:hypothetical protein BASA61_009398 [Batrachochytrium salamandrivorans]